MHYDDDSINLCSLPWTWTSFPVPFRAWIPSNFWRQRQCRNLLYQTKADKPMGGIFQNKCCCTCSIWPWHKKGFAPEKNRAECPEIPTQQTSTGLSQDFFVKALNIVVDTDSLTWMCVEESFLNLPDAKPHTGQNIMNSASWIQLRTVWQKVLTSYTNEDETWWGGYRDYLCFVNTVISLNCNFNCGSHWHCLNFLLLTTSVLDATQEEISRLHRCHRR